MAKFMFFKRGEVHLRVLLSSGRCLRVGSSGDCDVVLLDSAIPSVAFEVGCDGEHSFFHLRARTGAEVRINGLLVENQPLKAGDEISLGAWRVLFGDSLSSTTRSDVQMAKHQLRVVGPAFSEDGNADQIERHVACLDRLTMGRAADCDLVLNHPSVASVHALIETREGRRWIRDLNSSSGTFVSGAKIWAVELLDDVPVHIGPFELMFRSASTTVEARGGLTRPKPSKSTEEFQAIVGKSPQMKQVFHLLARVATSDATVLVTGESGTGKELAARAIHQKSIRSQGPFVPINCGALSEHLVESELFGHEKGAFTGADRPRKGAFEEANGGTLFLDEIGELPLSMQAKLLRALELFEVKRVGASKSIHVDLRVVCATNRDLRREVSLGHFREDLYWRLSALQVRLPPVRQRGRQDVLSLVDFFLRTSPTKTGEVHFTQEALDALSSHLWPGNVRELKHCIERTLLLRHSDLIDVNDLQFDEDALGTSVPPGLKVLEGVTKTTGDALSRRAWNEADSEGTLGRALFTGGAFNGDREAMEALNRGRDVEFHRVCAQMGYCVSAIARTLGTSRGTIYRRMHRLGLKRGEELENRTLASTSSSSEDTRRAS